VTEVTPSLENSRFQAFFKITVLRSPAQNPSFFVIPVAFAVPHVKYGAYRTSSSSIRERAACFSFSGRIIRNSAGSDSAIPASFSHRCKVVRSYPECIWIGMPASCAGFIMLNKYIPLSYPNPAAFPARHPGNRPFFSKSPFPSSPPQAHPGTPFALPK